MCHAFFSTSLNFTFKLRLTVLFLVLAVKLQQVMGTVDTMSTITMSNSESTSLSVLKLRDNGSNWADHKPRLRKAMGSKGLWRHVEGTAIAPKPYIVADGIPVLSDGKTQATEEQIETKEVRIIDFEKREYSACKGT